MLFNEEPEPKFDPRLLSQMVPKQLNTKLLVYNEDGDFKNGEFICSQQGTYQVSCDMNIAVQKQIHEEAGITVRLYLNGYELINDIYMKIKCINTRHTESMTFMVQLQHNDTLIFNISGSHAMAIVAQATIDEI